jgi:HD superfamily phosphodiesterase
MEWEQLIHTLVQMAEPYLKIRNDILHTQISHQYALRLLGEEGGDRRVVEPAILLHDVGWSALTPEQIRKAYGVRAGGEEAERLNRIHERSGAVIAGRLLRTLNYDAALTERITAMIERHDSGTRPESLEEKILKDADRLWRFSKAGFWTEAERQDLTAAELYPYIEKRRTNWFFTATASRLAELESKHRAEEIKLETPTGK